MLLVFQMLLQLNTKVILRDRFISNFPVYVAVVPTIRIAFPIPLLFVGPMLLFLALLVDTN